MLLGNNAGDPFIGGEKVKLKVKQIKAHKTWKQMTPKYQKFVLSNADTIFTVELDQKHPEIEHNQVVCLKEDPSEVKFLFVNADLKRVNT